MNEQEFAFRIRQALNEGADSVSYKASLRLEKARQMAVARARGAAVVARPATVRLPALQLAAIGNAPVDGPGHGCGLWGWLRGAGLVAPLITLAIGFVAIYEWQSRQFIAELADVDFAVLLDDAPIGAYADAGFGAMLIHRAASVGGNEIAGEPHADASTTDASGSDASATDASTTDASTPDAGSASAAAAAATPTPVDAPAAEAVPQPGASSDGASVTSVPAQR